MKKRAHDLARHSLAFLMILAVSTLPLFALLSLGGCPGVGGGVACTRHPDGTIECNVEIHNNGKHDEPVK